jgi:transcriptional regulator with XRE-family HTH domain
MEAERESKKFTLTPEKNVLKQIREAFGYTQEEFASAIGSARRTISRYETGEREPVFSLSQIKKLQKLLFALGLDFQDLPDDWNVTIKVAEDSQCPKEKVGSSKK